MATFLTNEINSSAEGDITGPTVHFQIVFPLKDNYAGYLNFILGRRGIKQSKKVKLCAI